MLPTPSHARVAVARGAAPAPVLEMQHPVAAARRAVRGDGRVGGRGDVAEEGEADGGGAAGVVARLAAGTEQEERQAEQGVVAREEGAAGGPQRRVEGVRVDGRGRIEVQRAV